ncbi:MAG: tryptophan--tRNA ligase [Candidatus Cloacimonetes bacterium 4572_65]|nr:MAG: tryptophan--tRNA ligase [Candidatus Cloacimonetes bacterium 4572_65]
MIKKVSLTGIKPTGMPHLGNYVGSIRPALELAEKYDACYFIADYHALNQVRDPEKLKSMTFEVAAAWLACGLDPDKVLFYRQSDVPETFELAITLMAFTPKGLMNRAHAYKALVQKNEEDNKTLDDGVNIGLFTYPILMAADILLFNADIVPVGKDQLQHIEMANDIVQTINYNYKCEVLKNPEPYSHKEAGIIVGLDGRKMSKSYNNVIPLFLPEKKLRKMIMKIVTNSQGMEEVKDPDNCSVFSLYKVFATPEQQSILREKYLAGGMGWGEAKQLLFEAINEQLKAPRERYFELLEEREYVEGILQEGGRKARKIASETIKRTRKIIGID